MIEGLKRLHSVHLADKFSFPFPAASKGEHLPHAETSLILFQHPSPGKTKHGMSCYVEKLKIQQSKRLDTFVHLFLSSSVTNMPLSQDSFDCHYCSMSCKKPWNTGHTRTRTHSMQTQTQISLYMHNMCFFSLALITSQVNTLKYFQHIRVKRACSTKRDT